MEGDAVRPVVLSDKDMHITSIVNHQGGFPTKEEVMKHGVSDLPAVCEPYLSKYDFRWSAKDTRMLERDLIKGWRLVGKALAPWVPDHLLSVNGAIERYSSVLTFRPKELGNAYRQKYQRASTNAIKAATKEGEKDRKDSPFYTAKLSPKEENTEAGTKPGEFVQERDF